MFSVKSDRAFVVFSYDTAHGLLLLRSRKSNGYPTRVDILFQDVRAVELRFWFDGVEIEETAPTYLNGRGSNPIEMIEIGNRVYSVTGRGWDGYIVGGIARIHEDEGEHGDKSALMSSPV